MTLGTARPTAELRMTMSSDDENEKTNRHSMMGAGIGTSLGARKKKKDD